MQSLHSKRLEKEMCRSVSSAPGAYTKLLEMLADDPHTCRPMTLEDIEAQWLVWSTGPRIVQISMLRLVLRRKRWHIPRLKMNGTRLRPERLHRLCVHDEEGGRFTLVLHAAVHKRGSRKQGKSVVFRGALGKHRQDGVIVDARGPIPRRQPKRLSLMREDVFATGLRLQSVCLIDRDQRLMQRGSAEQGRSRLAQMAGVRAMGQERARRANPYSTSWSKASQNSTLEVQMVWQQDGLAVLRKEVSLSQGLW